MAQYNAALVITGAEGASRDHVYRDLGLEAFVE